MRQQAALVNAVPGPRLRHGHSGEAQSGDFWYEDRAAFLGDRTDPFTRPHFLAFKLFFQGI